MLVFDMTLMRFTRSISKRIQRRIRAALPIDSGARLVARIGLTSDAIAEITLDNAVQDATEADRDGDDDKSIFGFVAKQEYSHGKRKGVESMGDSTTGGRQLYNSGIGMWWL